MNSTTIITRSGVEFDLADPKPELVNIRDIAYSLSRQQRFLGHAHDDINVALHSTLIAQKAPARFRLDALLHDAAEAYTGDVTRPMKCLLGSAFKEIETPIQEVVAEAFGLQWPPPDEVLVLDDLSLKDEIEGNLKKLPGVHGKSGIMTADYRTNSFLAAFVNACACKERCCKEWCLPEYNKIDLS